MARESQAQVRALEEAQEEMTEQLNIMMGNSEWGPEIWLITFASGMQSEPVSSASACQISKVHSQTDTMLFNRGGRKFAASLQL